MNKFVKIALIATFLGASTVSMTGCSDLLCAIFKTGCGDSGDSEG